MKPKVNVKTWDPLRLYILKLYNSFMRSYLASYKQCKILISRWSQETSRSPVRPVAPRPGLSWQPTLLNTFYNTIDTMHYQNRQWINSVDISNKQIKFYFFNNICVTIYNQWKSQVPYTSDAWVGKKVIHVVIHGSVSLLIPPWLLL